MSSIRVIELAKLLESEYSGDGNFLIQGMNSLQDAKECEISFIVSEKYKDLLEITKAEVILAPIVLKGVFTAKKTYIYCTNPNVVFSKIVKIFSPPSPEYTHGIHTSANVDKSAVIPSSCHIGPNVVIERDVNIGNNTRILAGTYIGEGTKIGDNCFVYPNCVIRERVQIGNNVIIHPGVCIGSDGFGYESTSSGIVKIPQVGSVRIDDDVEIGANSTIDRARFGTTWIKKGVKIDNLVQVALNVEVGENSMLIGQCGIAGSAKIGSGVIIAGQAGISHGLKVGNGALIAGQAGVTQDVPEGARWGGTPAMDVKAGMALICCPASLQKQKQKIIALEKAIKGLQEELDKLKK